MIFSLEALQAEKGDSLILHFGAKNKSQCALIDGGPGHVYEKTLKCRLKQIKNSLSKNAPLPLAFAMVSHIDDDHIHGILDWFADWSIDPSSICSIGDFWFNSFADGLKQLPPQLKTASLGADPRIKAAALGGFANDKVAAVVASVGQGRSLRGFLQQNGIQVNAGQNFLIADKSKTSFQFGKLRLTVVSPNKARLLALFKKWQSAAQVNDKIKAAAYTDQSIENLSSLVVMAEMDGKRMLLTGDARGDDILAGLEDAGFIDREGKCNIDLLKIPHHGSDRDVKLEFFQTVIADHYVISANGQDDNPDADTLCWIAQARGKADYTLYLTNYDNPQQPILKKNIEAAFKKFPELKQKTRFRQSKALSISIDLGDAVSY